MKEFIDALALEYAFQNKKGSRCDIKEGAAHDEACLMFTFPDGKKGLIEVPRMAVWGEINIDPNMVTKHHRALVSRQELEKRLLAWAQEKLTKKSKKALEKVREKALPRPTLSAVNS